MKKTQSVMQAFLLILTFVSIPHIYADTNTAQKQPLNPVCAAAKPVAQPAPAPTAPSAAEAKPSTEQVVFVDKLLSSYVSPILAQLTKINSGLEDLALLVNNSNVEDQAKKMCMTAIREIRNLIESINTNAFLNIDIFTLYELLKINQTIMDHLEQELPKGIEGFTALNSAKLHIKNIPATLNLETIHELLQNNNAQMERVETAIKNVGVSKFNKAYRILNKYVIDPALNRGRLRQALLLTAASAVGIWWFYRFTDSNMFGIRNFFNLGYPAPSETQLKEKTSEILMHMVPQLIAVEDSTQRLSDKNLESIAHGLAMRTLTAGRPQTWFYKLENTGLENVTNPFTQLIVAGTYFLRPYYTFELAKMWDWLKLKALKLHNNCMGGVYTQQKISPFSNQIDPKTTFKNLVGLEHVKKELSVLVDYVKDPEPFDRAKRTPQKGYLLLGPTRTGKSYSAKALAGELYHAMKDSNLDVESFGFFEIPAAAIIEARGINYFIDIIKASGKAPCILFIDEIDMLGLQRAGGSKELLADFLTVMSGTLDSSPNKQIIVLAATNRPENLDEALRQRGRFGTEIRFEYPSIKDRAHFITLQLNSIGVNLKNFNIEKLSLEVGNNISFEDLKCMITNAIDLAKQSGEILAQKHLEQSLNETIRHIEYMYSKHVPESEQAVLAAHQAGHALATQLLSSTKKVGLVTIRPVKPRFTEELAWSQFDGKPAEDKQQNFVHGSLFTYRLQDSLNQVSYQDAINECKIELAGHIAEHILLGGSGYSYHTEDKDKAFGIAIKIVSRGVNVRYIPNGMDLKNKYFNETMELIEKLEGEVSELLTAHKDTLVRLADELRKRKDLTGDDVAAIIKGNSLDTVQTQEPLVSAHESHDDSLEQEIMHAAV